MQRSSLILKRERSFRDSYLDQKRAVQSRLKRIEQPKWLKVLKKVYHRYGLKHLLLIVILVFYQFFGAAVFFWTEAGAEEHKEEVWNQEIQKNRTIFMDHLIPAMFNNTDFFLYLSAHDSSEMYRMLELNLKAYEIQLDIKYTDQKIHWDFWNAMLYAGTICTTIGYGHLYPNTVLGRLFTMVYALIGIPLVFSILDDLGKLLTKCMKYPWFLIKMFCRRAFRYCTKQSLDEIRRIDRQDRGDLAVFDLPIPVAIGFVIAWIFICSATFCIWEKQWDYFVAFYFFFISLSTIGLGDIVPDKPRYLLMLFGYIIVGLSLVSMCINLIQAKMENTYQAGKDDISEPIGTDSDKTASPKARSFGPENQTKTTEQPKRVTIGVLQRRSSNSLSSKCSSPTRNPNKRTSRFAQTLLSFPSPSKKPPIGDFIYPSSNGRACSSKNRVIPTSLSIDDVIRLVDTELDDIIILSELSVQHNFESRTIKEVETHIEPEESNENSSNTCAWPGQQASDLDDIEEIEELEDQILLETSDYGTGHLEPGPSPRNPKKSDPNVHFRSRLSLISPGSQNSLRSDSVVSNRSNEAQQGMRSATTPTMLGAYIYQGQRNFSNV